MEKETREKRKAGRKTKSTYIVGPSFDLLVESMLILIPKRWIPNQENVEDDSCSRGRWENITNNSC